MVGDLLEKREHVEDRSKAITGNVELLKDKSEKTDTDLSEEGNVVRGTIDLFENIMDNISTIYEEIQNLLGSAEEMRSNVEQIRDSIDVLLKAS